jgi:Sec-independent protein translocase protein TatA
MGALSITHILLAVAVGVIVFAPSKLPQLLRTVRNVSSDIHNVKSTALGQADELRTLKGNLESEIQSAVTLAPGTTAPVHEQSASSDVQSTDAASDAELHDSVVQQKPGNDL